MHNAIIDAYMPDIMDQGIYLLRLFLACICGGAVGFERSLRFKEAGLRTHVIVALGSCLAMIISKYGFFDVVVNESMQADVSRIGSNILPSIAFLGAGMIFTRSGSIKGLTTAAGIWATACIGLAIGCGLYILGLASTLIIVITHMILHHEKEFNSSATIHLHYGPDEVIPEDLRCTFQHEFDCHIRSFEAQKNPDGSINVVVKLRSIEHKSMKNIDLNLMKHSNITKIEQ